MTIKSAKCPECGAIVDIKDGLSTFYCMHCGCQLTVDDQSDTLIKAKVRVKEIEHQTERLKMRLADKKDERDTKNAETEKDFKRAILLIALPVALALILLGGTVLFHNVHTNSLERKIDEIQQDIEDGNFNEAETKIESLQDDDYSLQDKFRWWKTRRTLRKQLKEAKKDSKDD